jgi:lipopolysaccharide/colanic/teichoic acid biosynthesis glycosyltransferase
VSSRRKLIGWLIASDAVALTLAVVFTDLLRGNVEDLLGVQLTPIGNTHHIVMSIVLVPLALVLFRLVGLYDFDWILGGTREYGRIAQAATYSVMLVLAASYFAGSYPLVSRTWLVLSWLLAILMVATSRFTARRVIRRLRLRGQLQTRVVIVGASNAGLEIAEQLLASPEEGIVLLGFLDEYAPLGRELVHGVRVVGRPAELERRLRLGEADEYILVPDALPHQRLEELSRLMVGSGGATVRVAASSIELLTYGVLVAERARVPLMTARRARITGGEAVLKHAFDLVGAAVALLVLAPAVVGSLAVAAARGRRPLFRRQPILDRNGRVATMLLFSRNVSSLVTVRGAPALLSVLAGKLSLVGPRPRRAAEISAPTARQLTGIKPGLTGPWRLVGAEATLEEQDLGDLTYVRTYTVWEDFRIAWESLKRIRERSDAEALGRWQAAPRSALED